MITFFLTNFHSIYTKMVCPCISIIPVETCLNKKLVWAFYLGEWKKNHLHELMEVSIIKLCLSFNGNQKLALSAYSEFIQFELCSKFDVSLATRCVLVNSNYIVTSFGNNYSFNQTNYHHHHFCCWNCVCRELSSTCISSIFQARIRI